MLEALEAVERAQGGGGGRGGPVSALARTHPLTEDRVETVRKLLPQAYQIYNGSCAALQEGWRELARLFG
jgi:predicted Zn-dependent protease